MTVFLNALDSLTCLLNMICSTNTLPKRRLGKTEMMVSAISFGGLVVRINDLNQKQTEEVLRYAIDMGINYIDTAEGYGESEEYIGNALAALGCRSEIFLATKTGKRTAEEAVEAVHQSLERLQTDYIDLHQIHYITRPEDLDAVLAPGGALEGLKECREKGLIKHIGVTGHRNDLLVEALKTNEFETVMTIFNIAQPDAIKSGLIDIAKDMDVGIIAMKALCKGFLRPIHTLRYLLADQNHVATIPVGMGTIMEIVEDVSLGILEVSASEIDELQEITDSLEDSRCIRCNYCKDMDISAILSLYDYREKYGLTSNGEKEWRKVIKKAEDLLAANPHHYEEGEGLCPRDLHIGEMIKEAISLYKSK